MSRRRGKEHRSFTWGGKEGERVEKYDDALLEHSPPALPPSLPPSLPPYLELGHSFQVELEALQVDD